MSLAFFQPQHPWSRIRKDKPKQHASEKDDGISHLGARSVQLRVSVPHQS